MYNMSCSEVMYQAYYPYLYQRAGAAPPVSAHPVPRTGPFSSPFGAAHQYDRVNTVFIYLQYLPTSADIYLSIWCRDTYLQYKPTNTSNTYLQVYELSINDA